jgi:hypothetical protein
VADIGIEFGKPVGVLVIGGLEKFDRALRADDGRAAEDFRRLAGGC